MMRYSPSNALVFFLLMATPVQGYAQNTPTVPSTTAASGVAPALPPAAAGLLPPEPAMAAPIATLAMPVATPTPAVTEGASIPSVPNVSVSATATPVTKSLLPTVPFENSMGKAKVSILFTPNQIHALDDALTFYESKRPETTPTTTAVIDVPLVAPAEEKKIEEPATYPVFYLTSIVYHDAHDWSIWVSGRKITSAKNKTTLKILRIAPDRVTFGWTPPYGEAVALRVAKHLFAPTDAVKNKLTTSPGFSYDANTNHVTFSLMPNQSFSAAYFTTFEGFIASPPLPPLPTDKSADSAPLESELPPVSPASIPTVVVPTNPVTAPSPLPPAITPTIPETPDAALSPPPVIAP